MRDAAVTREAAAQFRDRATRASVVAEATKRSEEADKQLDELKNAKSCGARLGVVPSIAVE